MSTPDTSIRPQDINTSRHFFNGFDHYETEISANWLVFFCQTRGKGWEPFSLTELEAVYAPHEGFQFNRLTPRWVKVEDDIVTLTAEFVAKCHQVSPR